ncbi:MAG: hypothetical protein ABIP75_06030 [Pyrinomonadaceae bacterium]
MKKFYQLAPVCLTFVLCAGAVSAQRPRMGETPKDDKSVAKTAPGQTAANPIPPEPETVKVKYEGGYFGYNQKMDGMFVIDDMNERLVFKNKAQKEMFWVPYVAIMAAYGDTQSRRPAAASVIGSSVPYGLGLPALLIKKKYRYMNVQYRDDEMNTVGLLSFKFENEQSLAAMLQSLADKSGLTQRGEVFVRRRSSAPARNPDGSVNQ